MLAVRFGAMLFAALRLARAWYLHMQADRPTGAAPVARPNVRFATDGVCRSRRYKALG